MNDKRGKIAAIAKHIHTKRTIQCSNCRIIHTSSGKNIKEVAKDFYDAGWRVIPGTGIMCPHCCEVNGYC